MTDHQFHQSFAIPRVLALFSIGALLLLMLVAMIVQPALTMPIFGSEVLGSLFCRLVGASIIGSSVIVNGLVLAMKYQGDAQVKEKQVILADLNTERFTLSKLQNQISVNHAKKTVLQAETSKQKAKENATLTRLHKQELDEIELVNAKLRQATASIDNRRNIINQSVNGALNALQPISLKISELNDQLRSLKQAESTELAGELHSIQTQFVDSRLKNITVLQAHAQGHLTSIGNKRIHDLAACAIYSAYDVSLPALKQVRDFGPGRTRTLMAWRHAAEHEAKTGMPSDLSPAARNMIRAKYAASQQDLEARRDTAQLQVTKEEISIRGRYDLERRPLIQEQAAAQLQTEQQRQEVNRRYAQPYVVPTQAIAQQEKELAEKLHLIDAQTMAVKRDKFACNWRLAKIEYELTAYKNIRFNSFLRSAFF